MKLTDGLDRLSFWCAWVDHGDGESQIFSMRMYNLDPNHRLHLLSSMLGLPILKSDGGHFPVFLWKMFLRIVCSRYGAYLKVIKEKHIIFFPSH
ncbi:hypothetical protein BHM03_00015362 [Ensete ventricosum]|nr:hypothetical protein BHM03_00015362 [Ensete ventricosum]